MKKWIIIGIIAILVIAGVFALKAYTGNVIKDTEIKNTDIKEFTVKAFRFGYTPDTITVNKGDKVKINIENFDTLHGMRIPELEIRGDETLEFTADKTGEFDWYCTNMCGEGHMQMKGKLIVK
ncbi:MAG: cupredoxin domain-containing protein [Nanoarchaeota archaeon]|nr:cupredoxin domain-containing protein [Nanoarchaeota archaeon]